jgi:hypothetical protein
VETARIPRSFSEEVPALEFAPIHSCAALTAYS